MPSTEHFPQSTISNHIQSWKRPSNSYIS